MSLQVVIAVEALRALITLERSIVLRVWLSLRVMAIHVLHVRCVSTVICWHHRGRHTTDQSKLAVWVSYVGQYGPWQRILV